MDASLLARAAPRAAPSGEPDVRLRVGTNSIGLADLGIPRDHAGEPSRAFCAGRLRGPRLRDLRRRRSLRPPRDPRTAARRRSPRRRRAQASLPRGLRTGTRRGRIRRSSGSPRRWSSWPRTCARRAAPIGSVDRRGRPGSSSRSSACRSRRPRSRAWRDREPSSLAFSASLWPSRRCTRPSRSPAKPAAPRSPSRPRPSPPWGSSPPPAHASPNSAGSSPGVRRALDGVHFRFFAHPRTSMTAPVATAASSASTGHRHIDARRIVAIDPPGWRGSPYR